MRTAHSQHNNVGDKEKHESYNASEGHKNYDGIALSQIRMILQGMVNDRPYIGLQIRTQN